MGVGELRRLKQLEDENWCLKGLVADLTLDKHILQEVLKKVLRPVRRRELVNQVVEGYEISRQRACRLILLRRSSFYYRSRRREHVALKMRIKELALVRVRFGYPRLDGAAVARALAGGQKPRIPVLSRARPSNEKQEKARKLARAQRGERSTVIRANEKWAMDFLAERLDDGRAFRILTMIDQLPGSA